MVRQRAHRNESLRGLRGQYKTQLAAENPLCTHVSIIFWGPDYINISLTAPISVSICPPSQFAHLHGKPHRRPFRLQRTHVISIPFWVAIHKSMLAFMRAAADTLQWGQISCSFLYLPPSVGLLLAIWTRFSVRVYDRAWEASFSLFYLPPSVGLLPTIWTRFSVRVYDRAWEAYFALFLSTAECRLTRAIFGTQSRSSYELK